MGLFDFLKKKNASSKNEEEIDQNAMVIDTFSAIDEKCEYGDAMEKLNEHERLFYITQTLEQEVNNGGFSQYFYNSSGNFANEVVDAFLQIGGSKLRRSAKKRWLYLTVKCLWTEMSGKTFSKAWIVKISLTNVITHFMITRMIWKP